MIVAAILFILLGWWLGPTFLRIGGGLLLLIGLVASLSVGDPDGLTALGDASLIASGLICWIAGHLWYAAKRGSYRSAALGALLSAVLVGRRDPRTWLSHTPPTVR